MEVDLFGVETPNATSLLTTLALINVNWEDQRRSYLDNFVPFVVEALRTDPSRKWDDASAKDALAAKFGLILPARVVGSLLKRSAKQGLTLRDHGQHILTAKGRATETSGTFGAHQSACLRQQKNLAKSLVDLAQERFNLSWTEEEAESALAIYIETHAVPLLASSTRGDAMKVLDRSAGRDYVISVFLAEISRTDPEKFRYLDQMVKGSMLASALYLNVQSDVDSRFRDTTLYFDTPILLKALGLEGPEAESAGRQVLQMVASQGARLGCFEHTLREVTGVLDAAKNALQRGAPRSDDPGVLSFLRSSNETASDVDLVIARLDSKVRALGVSVIPTQPFSAELGIDESALEDLLQQRVGYARAGARVTDVNSLYAIHRARRGTAPQQLERCKAVLVTDNERIVRAAHEFFGRQEHGWPIAMLEHDLAALVWIKEPQRHPDLPRAQVIADCIAAHLPSPPLWAKVTEEIERLQVRGRISEADIAILRYSHGASQAIMDVTLGEPGQATTANVLAALDSAKREVQAPILAERDRAIQRAGDAELAIDEIQRVTQELRDQRVESERQSAELTTKVESLSLEMQSASALEARLRKRANSRAKRRSKHMRTGIYLLCTVLVILAIATLIPAAASALPTWATWGARAAGALVIVTGVFGTVPEIVRSAEVRLSTTLERRFLSQMDLLD